MQFLSGTCRAVYTLSSSFALFLRVMRVIDCHSSFQPRFAPSAVGSPRSVAMGVGLAAHQGELAELAAKSATRVLLEEAETSIESI